MNALKCLQTSRDRRRVRENSRVVDAKRSGSKSNAPSREGRLTHDRVGQMRFKPVG